MDDLISILAFIGFLLVSLIPAWKKAKQDAKRQEQPESQPGQAPRSPWEDIFGDDEVDDDENEVLEEVQESPVENTEWGPQGANEAFDKYSGEVYGRENEVFSYDNEPAGEHKPVPHVPTTECEQEDDVAFDLRAAVIGSAILNNPYREET
ncbi:MAG: hypothetical protein SPJ13_05625 [Bacteroidales bacterium]|nr:hypothetical protein [Bacteroidales bacterium]